MGEGGSNVTQEGEEPRPRESKRVQLSAVFACCQQSQIGLVSPSCTFRHWVTFPRLTLKQTPGTSQFFPCSCRSALYILQPALMEGFMPHQPSPPRPEDGSRSSPPHPQLGRFTSPSPTAAPQAAPHRLSSSEPRPLLHPPAHWAA